jgi:hypothetical protein
MIVAADNSAVGKTPMVAELEPGVETSFTFELDGYQPQEISVTPAEGQDVEVSLKPVARHKSSGKNSTRPRSGGKSKPQVGDNTLAPSF